MPHLFAGKSCPLVGMLHCPPLPGSPGFSGSRSEVLQSVLRDAATLVEGGFDGLMLENFGDAPFFPRRVPRHVVAEMCVLAAEVRRSFDIPLGINVLRNDGCSALEIAAATGASFIRVNVLTGARVTDQGLVEGIAHQLLRLRAQLGGSESIAILADVDVKHSAAIASRPLVDEADDCVQRGRADAIIVSGTATGGPSSLNDLDTLRDSELSVPLWVGSGVTPANIAQYTNRANGMIIGSSLKENGIVTNPVDAERVQRLMANHRDERMSPPP